MQDENNVEAETPTEITKEPSQDPVEQEIAREKEKGKVYTEAEKAAFNLKKNAEKAKELGVDPAEVLGISAPDNDDEVPEWFKRREAAAAAKTADELAEQIEDPRERELVKLKLSTVVTSGSPEERIRVARGYVNSVKNGQIAEELGRKGSPGSGSSVGAPPNKVPTTPELTQAEQMFTRAPFNMSAAEIIAKRPQA